MLTKDGERGGEARTASRAVKEISKICFLGSKLCVGDTHPLPQIHTHRWCLLRRRRRKRRKRRWWAISWLGYFRKNKISKIPVYKDRIKRGT